MFKLKLVTLKTLGKSLEALGRGTSALGMLDQKLKFNLIDDIDLSKAKVIFVMGTNGKTTSANLVSDIITTQAPVINNREGANLVNGILTTLIKNTKSNKELTSDVLVLEVDEKTLKHVVKFIEPDEVLITNFFRDQLDRYGEIDSIVEEIIQTLGKTKARIHLNANDPLNIYKFEKINNEKLYFGINKHEKVVYEQDKIVELKYCPKCKEKLHYHYYHYAHIGNYECKKCDFKMNQADTNLTLNYNDKEIEIDGKKIKLDVSEYPIYYFYNLIGAISVVKATGYQYDSAVEGIFKDFVFPRGRSQHFHLSTKDIYFNLTKNVVGMEESLEYMLNYYQNQKFDLCIAFNDFHADGLDVSWIWDANMAVIKEHVNNIYIVGERRYDMALRFEYEGFNNIIVKDDIESGVKTALDASEKRLAIITNYTPLVKVDTTIQKWASNNDNN